MGMHFVPIITPTSVHSSKGRCWCSVVSCGHRSNVLCYGGQLWNVASYRIGGGVVQGDTYLASNELIQQVFKF